MYKTLDQQQLRRGVVYVVRVLHFRLLARMRPRVHRGITLAAAARIVSQREPAKTFTSES